MKVRIILCFFYLHKRPFKDSVVSFCIMKKQFGMQV